MQKVILIGIAAALAVAASAANAQQATKPLKATEQASKIGAQLYVSTGCIACHGNAGQGSNSGPRLAGRTFPLEFFSRQMRQPMDEMPPYSERVIDAQQLAALHAYVSTLK